MEDNCFTILCWLLLYIKMTQPKVHVCSIPLELPPHLPNISHPSRLSQSTGFELLVLHRKFPLTV